MTSPLRLTGLGATLVLLTGMPQASAQDSRTNVVLWDQSIASDLNDMLLRRPDCRDNPYRANSRECLEPSLNIILHRARSRDPSFLDRIVVFVDDHRRLEADRQFDGGTRLKFDAQVQTLTPDEAEVEVTFKIQF